MSNSDYLHGYTLAEQDRLLSQSDFLEPSIYQAVDFSRQSRVLEVGCGVGAQLSVLARRFPHLQLTGIDREPAQVRRAEQILAKEIGRQQVELVLGTGDRLPWPAESYDGGFICWLLEHVPEPLPLLKELHRVLSPGAVLYCTEVFNHSLYASPAGHTMPTYWRKFNDYQTSLRGHPHIGPHLGNLLTDAGFQAIQTYPLVFHFDKRVESPVERRRVINYWQGVLMSAAPALQTAGIVDDAMLEELRRDFERLAIEQDSVLYVSAIQARAERF